MNDKLKHKYAYYSARYLEWFMETKSLNKIEKRISDENNNNRWREAFVASGYVYFNKMDILDKDKHPVLFEHVQKFSKAKPIVESKNDYDKVWVKIESLLSNKEINNNGKERLKKYILDYLEGGNLSLNKLCNETKVSYSNVYKTLYKGDLDQTSINILGDLANKINEHKRNES